MAKRLTPVDLYFIDNHKDTMSIETLAKQIGCSPRTIYNCIGKSKDMGEERTLDGREAAKDGKVLVPIEDTQIKPEVDLSLPPIGIHSLNLMGRRKIGTGGALVMTQEGSEMGDIINKVGPKQSSENIHIINPNKDD